VKNFEEGGGFRTSNNITWHIAKSSVPALKSHVFTSAVARVFHPCWQKRATKHTLHNTVYRSCLLRWILLVTFFVFLKQSWCHYIILLLRNECTQVHIQKVANAYKYQKMKAEYPFEYN